MPDAPETLPTSGLTSGCSPDTDPSAQLFARVAGAAAAVCCELRTARVVEVILEQACLFGAVTAGLFAADVEQRELTLLGQRGVPSDLVARIQRIPFGAPFVSARAAATGEIQIVEQPDERDSAMRFAHEICGRVGTVAVLSVPLSAAGTLVGVLTTSHARGGFTAEEIAAIRAVASVFAASLATARTHERDRMQLESLHVAALAISAPVALSAVLQNIVDQARMLTGAARAALGILKADDPAAPFDPWVFSGMTEREAEPIGRPPRPVGLLGAVAREGRTIRIPSIVEDARFQGFPLHHPRMGSFLGVPVFYLGRPVGNLYLADKQGAREFSADDERAVEMFAQYAGLVVEHAREHEILRRDVAQREREEEALRASEDHFRRLVESAPDVITRFGPGRGVEYVSPAVHAVLGHFPEDYYRDPGLLWKQIHPLDRPLLEAALRAPDAFSGPLTLRWIDPNGRLLWTECRIAPVRDAAGNVVAAESVAREVTDRKMAEGEIERLLERLGMQQVWLQTVLESSPTPIMIAEDPAGKRVTANRAAETLFGVQLRREAGISQHGHCIRAPRGAPPLRERPIVRALQGETVRGQELVWVRPDGREVPVLTSAAPVLDGDGRIRGAVAVYEDISALKELDRLRIEWTAIVAHDLRQPIQVIGTQVSLLAKTDPALAPKLARIRRANEQLTRMIADLLDLSHLEVREIPLALETVDVPALAREVVDRMGDERAGRPVRVEIGRDVPKIQADPLRLGEVLANLLSNAEKYGWVGTPIDVRIEVQGSDLVVSVTNEGEAIPPDEIPKLFERFRRAKGAAEGTTRGVGLGLYIAKGLVEAHGGRIWVESAPGRTTFHFALPVRPVESSSVERPAA